LLNIKVSGLIPEAEIDRRLAGINHFSAVDRRRFGSPGDCGAQWDGDTPANGVVVAGRPTFNPDGRRPSV
jgi:hypothetical protein